MPIGKYTFGVPFDTLCRMGYLVFQGELGVRPLHAAKLQIGLQTSREFYADTCRCSAFCRMTLVSANSLNVRTHAAGDPLDADPPEREH